MQSEYKSPNASHIRPDFQYDNHSQNENIRLNQNAINNKDNNNFTNSSGHRYSTNTPQFETTVEEQQH